MLGLLMLALVQGWQPCLPMPTPGYAFACAAVGSRVYAIGGLVSEADAAVPRTVVEAYDVPSDSWILGFAPPPGPRWYAGCAELDGKIYVIGGTDGNADQSRVDRFDPSTNTWDTVAPLPWPRSSLAGCAYGGRIYAIGGYSATPGTFERGVARFTPDSGMGRWDVIDSLNTRRANSAAAVASCWMCAVGGVYYSNLSSFEYSGGGCWAKPSRYMNSPRSGAAAVGWGEWLCAIGGQGKSGPLSSVEVVSMVNSQPWQYVPQMSVPRVFCGAAVVDTNVVVIGGRGDHGAEPSVERGSTSLFPSGVDEPQGRTQVQNTRNWASVVSDRVRIDCRSAAIYDCSGRRVFSGLGPVDVRLVPGVYFTQVTDEDGRSVTGTVTVVR